MARPLRNTALGFALGSALALTAPPAAVASVPVSPAASCAPAGYGVHSYAPGDGKTVALTFDDGPGPSTRAILAVLAARHVRATFFNEGANTAADPQIDQMEINAGHVVADHTWSHVQLTTLSSSDQAAQIDRARAEQAAVSGRMPCLFRPPYGSYNATTLALAQQRAMSVWTWSVDPEDWKANGSGSAYWIGRIITRAEAGISLSHPVVLLHNAGNGNPATVAALGPIIDFYRAHGYRFVDLTGRSGWPTGSAFGAYDRLARWPAGLRVDGWAIDPDTSAATRVDVYVDGVASGRYTAAGNRPDVGAVFPASGPAHGYAVTFPYVGAGSHSVCVYADNTAGGGDDRLLGCRAITVGNLPIGRVDSVQGGAGRIVIGGWALDPDTSVSISVVVTVDEVASPAQPAVLSRPDVAAAFPGWGDRHGFRITVPATAGGHRVCAYGVNAGPGRNAVIGCAAVSG